MYYTLYVKIKRIQQIGEDKTMSELERVETGLGVRMWCITVPMIWMVAMLRRQCTMVCLPFSTEGRKAAELRSVTQRDRREGRCV